MSGAQAAGGLDAFGRFRLLVGLVRRPWMLPLFAAHSLALFIAMLAGGFDPESIWIAAVPVAALGLLTPLFISGLSKSLSDLAWQDQLTLAGLPPRTVFLVDVGARLVIGLGITLSALPYLVASVEDGELKLLAISSLTFVALLLVAVEGALAAIQPRFIGRLAWRLSALLRLSGSLTYVQYVSSALVGVGFLSFSLSFVVSAALLLFYGIGQVERRPLILPPRIVAALLLIGGGLAASAGGAPMAVSGLGLAAQLIFFERPKQRAPGLSGLLARPGVAVISALLISLGPLLLSADPITGPDFGLLAFYFAVPAVLGLVLGQVGIDPVAGASLAASLNGYVGAMWLSADKSSPLPALLGGAGLLALIITRLRAGGAVEAAAAPALKPLPRAQHLPDRWPAMLVKELMALSRGPLFLLAFGLGIFTQAALIGALLSGEEVGAFGSGAPAVALLGLAAISSERPGHKLDLLLMMQSPGQLALGKWASVALLQLAIFSLSLPALVASYWMLQLDLLSALSAQLLTLCGALALSAVCLWISTASSWGIGVVMAVTSMWAAIFVIPMGAAALYALLPASPNLVLLSLALLTLLLVPFFLRFTAISCRTVMI